MTAQLLLTAKEMAEFGMRPTHSKTYRTEFVKHLEETHPKSYVDEVKRLMIEINKRTKS